MQKNMENNIETYNKDAYEDLSLRDAQMLMVEILEDVHNLCEKHGLKYFLDGGTLIGAVRHKGFIPWDDDIDIGMPREDYEKFIEIAKKELPDNLFLQTFETDKYYDVYPVPCKIRYNGTLFFEEGTKENLRMHNGVYIDIFPYDNLPKFKVIYKIQRTLSYNILKIITKMFPSERRRKFFDYLIKWNDPDSEYMGYGVDTFWSEYVYKKSDYFDLVKLNFEGREFYAPKNYDSILTQLYGDYMIMPKEEDRVWHAKEMKKLKKKN